MLRRKTGRAFHMTQQELTSVLHLQINRQQVASCCPQILGIKCYFSYWWYYGVCLKKIVWNECDMRETLTSKTMTKVSLMARRWKYSGSRSPFLSLKPRYLHRTITIITKCQKYLCLFQCWTGVLAMVYHASHSVMSFIHCKLPWLWHSSIKS